MHAVMQDAHNLAGLSCAYRPGALGGGQAGFLCQARPCPNTRVGIHGASVSFRNEAAHNERYDNQNAPENMICTATVPNSSRPWEPPELLTDQRVIAAGTEWVSGRSGTGPPRAGTEVPGGARMARMVGRTANERGAARCRWARAMDGRRAGAGATTPFPPAKILVSP